MFFPISSVFFIFTLLLGSLISISSPSWFGAWVGLELNLMSFIPLISSKANSYLSEAALKYFLIQALGSAILISSSFMFSSFFTFSSTLIFLALILKVGSAPFHFWFPQVMEGLLWPQALMLSTIQKLAPLTLISYLSSGIFLNKLIILAASLSALVGALGGFNLSSLRRIIAFSSINHLSWMMVAISTSDIFWLLYFFVYSAIVFSITTLFSSLQAFSLSSLIKSNQNKISFTLLVSFNFLSLSGIPPFTGFVPKWLLIQIMLDLNLFAPLFFLLTSSLVTLYFYLRIMIPMFVLINPVLNFNTKFHSLSIYSISMTMKTSFNFLGLFLPLYFLFT
uniref:NADH-ubiquinone oxidoreductase chain 2 n=1 Tax=Ocypode cordimanus TaxID=652466 RepID=A0A140GMB9_9EUCA|nr:NADH dehydrogenase subunit 2 [Ocypode cordimanus]AMN14555.1 NADH dehydrogenase subunit 2 [Ocypode cordimanus]